MQTAARRLSVALIRPYGFVAKRIITDKLRSYSEAKADLVPNHDHWSRKGLTRRAETALAVSKTRGHHAGLTLSGSVATVCVHALRYSQWLFSPSRRRAAVFFSPDNCPERGTPERVVIDKSGAALAGSKAVNVIMKFTGTGDTIDIRQTNDLNTLYKQDHRASKGLTGR